MKKRVEEVFYVGSIPFGGEERGEGEREEARRRGPFPCAKEVSRPMPYIILILLSRDNWKNECPVPWPP